MVFIKKNNKNYLKLIIIIFIIVLGYILLIRLGVDSLLILSAAFILLLGKETEVLNKRHNRNFSKFYLATSIISISLAFAMMTILFLGLYFFKTWQEAVWFEIIGLAIPFWLGVSLLVIYYFKTTKVQSEVVPSVVETRRQTSQTRQDETTY